MNDMRTSIENVLYDYVYYYDFGPMADVGKCFTEDGKITMADGSTVTGRANISEAFVVRREKTVFPPGSIVVHQVTNVHITTVSETEAKVRSVFAFHVINDKAVTTIATVGDYLDTFVKDTDDAWRIKVRIHRTYGRTPLTPQPAS